MIRFFLKLIPSISLVFLALSLAARALGGTQPPNPALHGFAQGCEGKPQPCWYGIVPGRSTLSEALDVMEEMGYSSAMAEHQETNTIFRGVSNNKMTVDFYHYYVPDYDDQIVIYIYLKTLDDLKFGDALAEYGRPATMYFSRHRDSLFFLSEPFQITFDGYYSARLSQQLNEIMVTNFYPLGRGGVGWQGLIGRARYCTLELAQGGVGCRQ